MTAQRPLLRRAGGAWRPEAPVMLPPIYAWPPRPRAVARWLFGVPGFLWPMNCLTLGIAVVTWVYLTPSLTAMKTVEPWWVGLLLVRNLALVGGFFGGLHLYLLVFKAQGSELKFSARPLATSNPNFLFGHQVRDNMCRTLCYGVPIITAYEAATDWLAANGWICTSTADGGSVAFWSLFGASILLAPVIHVIHFYVIHRALHWPPLYRAVHHVHHLNVEVGPWSGLSMHPVELAIYFSTVCVQWLIAVHPVNALFQIYIAALNAAVSHTGFDKVLIGGRPVLESNNYFHYLHHKHFECNYGATLVPIDQLVGTFHDGSDDVRPR
ncbi:MAG: sterol desaturase family protein [Alphaproteobacteria bacterium]|nr:sterol desaturase family protein [Alphaproteobacteria bacterium]